MLAPMLKYIKQQKTKKKQQNKKYKSQDANALCLMAGGGTPLLGLLLFGSRRYRKQRVWRGGKLSPPPNPHHLLYHHRPPQKNCNLFIKSEALACRREQEVMGRNDTAEAFSSSQCFRFSIWKAGSGRESWCPSPTRRTVPVLPTRP